MINKQREIAELLLQSKAIKLEPAKPFKWASGWNSPIYCDNRVTLSYPEIRGLIRDRFVTLIRKEFPGAELIAGVATGAIAQGVLVADRLDLPFVYVRSGAKDHGKQNLIEGRIDGVKNVVIVEDLISTGGSSLKAATALKEAGCNVMGMVAIFTYGFKQAEDNFRREKVKLLTLSNYESLLEAAIVTGYISQEHLEILRKWRMEPENWKK